MQNVLLKSINAELEDNYTLYYDNGLKRELVARYAIQDDELYHKASYDRENGDNLDYRDFQREYAGDETCVYKIDIYQNLNTGAYADIHVFEAKPDGSTEFFTVHEYVDSDTGNLSTSPDRMAIRNNQKNTEETDAIEAIVSQARELIDSDPLSKDQLDEIKKEEAKLLELNDKYGHLKESDKNFEVTAVEYFDFQNDDRGLCATFDIVAYKDDKFEIGKLHQVSIDYSGQVDKHEHFPLNNFTRSLDNIIDESALKNGLNEKILENPISQEILDQCKQNTLRSNSHHIESGEACYIRSEISKKDDKIECNAVFIINEDGIYDKIKTSSQLNEETNKLDKDIEFSRDDLSDSMKSKLVKELDNRYDNEVHCQRQYYENYVNSIECVSEFRLSEKYDNQEITVYHNIDRIDGVALKEDNYRNFNFSETLKNALNRDVDYHIDNYPIRTKHPIDAKNEDNKAKDIEQEFNKFANNENDSMAVINLSVGINIEAEPVATFDIVHRTESKVNEGVYNYKFIDSASEKVDLETRDIVHKSQSELDYGNYSHDEVRSMVSNQIKKRDLLSDNAITEFKETQSDYRKIIDGHTDEDKSSDRMVAR